MSGSQDSIRFARVSYGLDNARPRLDAMLNEVAQPVAGFPGATGNIRLMELVLPTVAAIKDPTFAEEQEWRLLSELGRVGGAVLPAWIGRSGALR